MKKLLLVGAALTALFGGSALAADLRRPAYTPPPPPPPVYNWTGFYIGGNLGGAWSRGSVEDSLFGLSASASRDGFIGGGQLGFNYQFSNIVLGVEWDFDWTSLDATGSGRSTPIGFLQASAETRWVSTLAARFGVAAWNSALLYGKAGVGWVDNSATVTNLTTGASISASNRNSGWLVGAGVEWALAGNWSAKLEYDFLHLDSLTFGPGPFLGDTFTTNREIQMLKVGLNYRFGYGGPAYGGPGYGGPGYRTY
jgi:outer membrane immunogenic protein